jgi:hypothetical protein
MSEERSRYQEAVPAPGGCRWCGIEEREHLQRWKPPIGWHVWTPPTVAQRKERMILRRSKVVRRKNATQRRSSHL